MNETKSPAVHKKAFAKINLALDIVGRRPDGYHLVDMIMQTVTLADDIYVRACPDAPGDITLRELDGDCGGNARILVPSGKDNLMYKAASLMKKRFSLGDGIEISFIKRIPSEAGLGGGSSDAAAVLKCINELYGLELKTGELMTLGAGLGADVPFFINGGTARVYGIGTDIRELKPVRDLYVLIAKPHEGNNTAEVYAWFDDALLPSAHPDMDALEAALEEAGAAALAENIFNVLEYPASLKCPLIGALKKEILESGASAAAMTGSGSAVFGLFADPEVCGEAAGRLGRSGLNDMLDGIFVCGVTG